MEEFRLWGTIVNTLAIFIGGLVGIGIRALMKRKQTVNGDLAKSVRRSEALTDTIFKGLTLSVLFVGITGVIKAAVNNQIKNALEGSHAGDTPLTLVADLAGERTLVIILSMVIGALIGQLLDLDRGINKLGNKIEVLAKNRFGNVADAFVTVSVLCCVGSMAIVGPLNSGLTGDHTMLYTKSILDFVTALVFGISMGGGVLFSTVLLFLFEGTITLLAQWIAPTLTTEVITCMSGVGSLLIIGLAFNTLGMTKLKIMNYTPAIFLPILLIPVADWLGTLL